MLLLTPDVANQVRGLTVEGHALAPVLLSDGNLTLPEVVLDDPYHAIHSQYLRDNTTFISEDSIERPIPPDAPGADTPIARPTIYTVSYETDIVLVEPHTYSEEWPEGEIIVVE